MSDDPVARARTRRARSKKRRGRHREVDEGDEARASSEQHGPSDRPKRTKKKKKKKSKANEAKRDKGAAPRDDWPPFARSYPRHPGLDALVAAFERGNFAEVRNGAPALIDGDEDESVKRAARDLRRRIDPAPTSMFLWALGVALLVFLYGFYLSHRH